MKGSGTVTDEQKAGAFCVSYLAMYTLCLFAENMAALIFITMLYAVIIAASAKLEKAEKRLQRYKDDADRRGREEMSESEKEQTEQPKIVMTRGKSA